ncbi:MAG: DUF3575 domain-containing protein, partial [Bacteroidales bacterium]
LSINLPSLFLGLYNIEGSKAISKGVSLHLPLSWSPHTLRGDRRVKHFIVMAGARGWSWHCYSGLFYGGYATAGIFNLNHREFRYQGEGAGATITAGYSKMLSRHFNLEIEGGLFVGLLHYQRYEGRCCGNFIEERWRGSLLPFKLSLSLLYLF